MDNEEWGHGCLDAANVRCALGNTYQVALVFAKPRVGMADSLCPPRSRLNRRACGILVRSNARINRFQHFYPLVTLQHTLTFSRRFVLISTWTNRKIFWNHCRITSS